MYLVKSNYLSNNRVDNYFKNKGWKRFESKKNKNPTLIYLDGMNIYDKSIYKYHSDIKNQIGSDKDFLTDKDNLPNLILKKYQPKTVLIDLKKDKLDNFKKYFKNNKVWILKPSRGREGIAIKIVKDFNNFEKYLTLTIKNLKLKFKKLDLWVMQEYIEKPLLYNDKKFHLRVYFLIFKKNLYLWPYYLIITAKNKFKNDDYNNKDIHDSHYKNSLKNKIFPLDINIEKSKVDKINYDIIKIFKSLEKKLPKLSCYTEDNNCFELFAADIIVTENIDLKVLEINGRIGWRGLDVMNKKFKMFEDQLDIVLKSTTKENLFIKIF